MPTSLSQVIFAGNPELQDRLEVLRFGERLVVAVADGAGGISGGTQAAEFFMRGLRETAASLTSPEACQQFLASMDLAVELDAECGQTTGLVSIIQPGRVFGASAGDSTAWWFGSGRPLELTCGQRRNPFLGTGVASGSPFLHVLHAGTIVVATDGLWKYTSLQLIEQRVREAKSESLADELAALVRLPSGVFPDDVAIATCRVGERDGTT